MGMVLMGAGVGRSLKTRGSPVIHPIYGYHPGIPPFAHMLSLIEQTVIDQAISLLLIKQEGIAQAISLLLIEHHTSHMIAI